MTIILRLKPWQLFLIFVSSAILSLHENFGSIFELIFGFVFLFWVYSIANIGVKKLSLRLKKRLYFLNFNLVFLFFWHFSSSLQAFNLLYPDDSINIQSQIMAWGFHALNVYAFSSIIYSFYLASIILGSINEGKLVGIRKALSYFIGFIVLPVGIWFIQIQAQKLAEDN
jgi:hypothetical protein